MKKRILSQLVKLLSYSVLLALVAQVGSLYPFGVTFVSLLITSLCLMVCFWYSKKVSRPMAWHTLVILLTGGALYGFLGWGIAEFLTANGYNMNEVRFISSIMLAACLLTIFLEKTALKEQFTERIDLWMPPVWLLAGGIFSVLLLEAKEDQIVRNFCIVSMAILLIWGTWNKSNRRKNKGITYEIDKRGYIKYLGGFTLVVVILALILPEMDELPGTYWVKEKAEAWWEWPEDDGAQIKLSRNPSRSNAIVLTVEADEPLYLRRRGYTYYEEGAWQEEEEDSNTWRPLDGESIYREYTLLRMMLQEIEAGNVYLEELEEKYQKELSLPMAAPEIKYAQIEEKKRPKSYLSVLGINSIEAERDEGDEKVVGLVKGVKPGQVGYIGMLENLYFSPIKEELQKRYTLEYKTNGVQAGTREWAILQRITPVELIRAWGYAYEQSYEMGYKILERGKSRMLDEAAISKYLEVPQEVEDALYGTANKMINDCTSELAKAEAICNTLKYSGTYTYLLGADYIDTARDPVVDFLLEGQKGICQDFASSMVLLCRIVGLPARYVTGYYATEEGSIPGQYVVREKDAHAFVEVYITGYGWMNFDPTTSIEPHEKTIGIGILNNWGSFSLHQFSIFQLILMAGIVIILWKYPVKRGRRYFRRFLLVRKAPEEALKIVLEKVLVLLEEKGLGKEHDETLTQFTQRLEQRGIDISPITRPFENYYYGKQLPDETTLKKVIVCYEELEGKKYH